MSPCDRPKPGPAKRLSEAPIAGAEPQRELFHVLLPADCAHQLRALADRHGTRAVDLIEDWVCEQLDEHQLSGAPLGVDHGQLATVIPLPFLR